MTIDNIRLGQHTPNAKNQRKYAAYHHPSDCEKTY